jgi:lipopolysaccharide/colanic/teichoic acid biosynthesis glycosyltransferase
MFTWTRPRLAMLRIKTFVEWWLALALAILALPVIAVLAVAIVLDSTGPVFYRGERVGRNGRFFTMWKLRSLEDGAPYRADKTSDDRATRVGRVLRRTSLDELPQLWNVLRGDMALVGPRPNVLVEVAQYNAVACQRLRVKPGMTGLWQVSGRADLSWQESLWLDLAYIRDWTPWLDLRIAARTVPCVVRAKGAY